MILQEIAQSTRRRVEEDKRRISAAEMQERAQALPKGEKAFEAALRKPGVSFICEVKKASPSRGIIDPEFAYLQIAADYVKAGADCISCLTEPKWFLGSDEIFEEIRSSVSLSMLRKDFTVDAYQIYQAKCMGADAVLLICALLDTKTIAQYLQICEDLGLSALVETHDKTEIDSAAAAGARLIGVNNRNLKTFSVDFSNTARLRDRIPSSALFIAESGVSSGKDAGALAKIGADAILVGEYLMRTVDKTAALANMREEAAVCR